MLRKPFTSDELLISHDDNTDGTDVALVLNHHWRKFLGALIAQYLNDYGVDFEDADNADRDDNIGAFWDDFYS